MNFIPKNGWFPWQKHSPQVLGDPLVGSLSHHAGPHQTHGSDHDWRMLGENLYNKQFIQKYSKVTRCPPRTCVTQKTTPNHGSSRRCQKPDLFQVCHRSFRPIHLFTSLRPLLGVTCGCCVCVYEMRVRLAEPAKGQSFQHLPADQLTFTAKGETNT